MTSVTSGRGGVRPLSGVVRRPRGFCWEGNVKNWLQQKKRNSADESAAWRTTRGAAPRPVSSARSAGGGGVPLLLPHFHLPLTYRLKFFLLLFPVFIFSLYCDPLQPSTTCFFLTGLESLSSSSLSLSSSSNMLLMLLRLLLPVSISLNAAICCNLLQTAAS